MRRWFLMCLGIATSALAAIALFLNVTRAETLQQLTGRFFPTYSTIASLESIPEGTDSEVQSALETFVAPVSVSGTNLVIDQIAAYDGPYIEDGTDREVVNVLALVLRNTANVGISHAELTFMRGKEEYRFTADTIPPGASVVVLEKQRKPYIDTSYTSCFGWTVEDDGIWLDKSILEITEVGMGTLSVHNISEKIQENVKIFYKTYLKDTQTLIGGITYTAMIPMITPGAMVEINPFHYASGYTQIVKVQSE